MWSQHLALGLLLFGVAGCATDSIVSSSGSGYSYAPPEQVAHPGIAEGRPVVEYNGFTFYACPPLAVGQETPLIEDACLTPGDAGASKYGDHSMLEPSRTCPDGRRATDAGTLGIGFVGEPLIGQTQDSPDWAEVYDCLAGLER